MEYYLWQKDPVKRVFDELSIQLCVLAAGAPLDRICTILRVQSSHAQLKPENHYSNSMSAAYAILTKQRLAGFWRGNLLPFLMYVPTAFFFRFHYMLRNSFQLFDIEKHWYLYQIETLAKDISLLYMWGFVIYPIYIMKVQLNLDVGSGNSKEFKSLKSLKTSKT